MSCAADDVAHHERPLTPKRHLGVPLVWLMSVATGLSVASNYYAQPLLPDLQRVFHLSGSSAGWVITVTQVGFGLGLMLLLPLGDLFERRRLVVILFVLAAVASLGVAASPSAVVLFTAAAALGLLSVVAQILVPYAASLASDPERGRVLGAVMTGLLLGVLVARTAAGYLAELGGWQTVYWVAAALMLLVAMLLRLYLPTSRAPERLAYPRLLMSVVALVRAEPVLRRRIVYAVTSFGALSALWTTIAFLLAGDPYHYSVGTIGLFGLVGAAGALAANVSGRLADTGREHLVTGVTSVLLCASWIPVAFGRRSLVALLVGIVVIDLAVQGLQVCSQSQIYALRPEARARLNSAYMMGFFGGGALGSALSTVAYGRWGWAGVCVVGASFGACATAVWLATHLRQRRAMKVALVMN